MRRAGLAVATLIVAGWMLTGCGGPSGSDEGGFGLGALAPEAGRAVLASAGVAAQQLSGTLTVRNDGCFAWSGDAGDGAWIVWPDTAEADPADGGRVVLDGGQIVSDGSALSAEGALVTLADLPDGANPDSYFGAYGGFCDAGSRGVILFTEVAPS